LIDSIFNTDLSFLEALYPKKSEGYTDSNKKLEHCLSNNCYPFSA